MFVSSLSPEPLPPLFVTVTLHTAVLLFSVVAIILQVPSPIATAFPVASTVAILELSLLHVIPVFTLALLGNIVGRNTISFVPPKSKTILELLKLILSGLMFSSLPPIISNLI